MTRTVSATEDEVEAAKHILALLDSTDDRVGVLMSALDGARDGCAIRSQAALAASSRARAEAEAENALLRPWVQKYATMTAREDEAAQARAAIATPSHVAAALVELERAARLAWAVPNPTATGAHLATLTALGDALANLDRARGGR